MTPPGNLRMNGAIAPSDRRAAENAAPSEIVTRLQGPDRKTELAAEVTGRKPQRVVAPQLEAWPVFGLIAAARKPYGVQSRPGIRDHCCRSLERRDGIFASRQIGDVDRAVGFEIVTDD